MSLWAPLVVLMFATSLGDAEPRFFEPTAWPTPGGASPAEVEQSRIGQHLRFVEETLRRETPADLSVSQRQGRARAMDALHAYWRRGEFPINRDAPRRTPVFIDAEGIPCAFGSLILASGAESLAREIATYENNDFVADIDHPALAAWLDSNGLTAAEAAWIQPNYGPCGYQGFIDQFVCGADGRTYECEVAAECAGVEVVATGSCSSGTSTGTGMGTGTGTGTSGAEPPEKEDVVLAEDVCDFGTTGTSTGEGDTTGDPSTTATGSSTSEGTSGGSSSGSQPTGSSSGSQPTGSSSGEPPGANSQDDGGCRFGGSGSMSWASLLLLAFVRRRQA